MKATDLPADRFEVTQVLGSPRTKIACKKCNAGWEWPRDRELSAGAHLELLDHAASHDSPMEDDEP